MLASALGALLARGFVRMRTGVGGRERKALAADLAELLDAEVVQQGGFTKGRAKMQVGPCRRSGPLATPPSAGPRTGRQRRPRSRLRATRPSPPTRHAAQSGSP